MALVRKEGEVQPGIRWGKYFTMRIPGIHVAVDLSMALQGGLLSMATGAAVAPLFMRFFGFSFEIAWALAVVPQIFWVYAGAWLFGDTFAPGWITPSLPLTMVFLAGFEPGIPAIQAMTALVIIVSLIFLFFAVTGLGSKFFQWMPIELRAGIILGSAIAAFNGEFARHATMPVTLSVVWGVLFLLMFSVWIAKSKETNKIIRFFVSAAMLVGFLIAAVVGPLSGEFSFNIQAGIFIPPFMEAFRAVSPFFIGWPSWDMYVQAFPLAVMVYVIVFGDLILGSSLLQDAARTRTDEIVEIDPTRTHYVLFFRNIGQLLTAGAFIPMHGPVWTGVTVFFIEQYKMGRKNMDSIFTGLVNWSWLVFIIVWFNPLVSFMRPILPVALSITMILTGFACAYVAMRMVNTPTSQGYALFIGLVIVKFGPAWGLIIGVALFLLLLVQRKPTVAIPYEIDMKK